MYYLEIKYEDKLLFIDQLFKLSELMIFALIFLISPRMLSSS